jgi:apolipoprotein N-acyltransferase
VNPERWSLRTRLLGAVASAALLFLSFPPVDLGWLAFIAVVPLFMALRGVSMRVGALIGGLFGAVFYAALMSWLSLFGFLALAALGLAMGAFFAVWGALAARALGTLERFGRLAVVPVLWGALEVISSRWPFGGLTWGTLGTTQHDGGPMLGVARLAGLTALGVLIGVVNALLAEALTTRSVQPVAPAILLVAAPTLLPLGAPAQAGTMSVAAVQANVPPERFRGFGRVGRVGAEDTVIVDNHLRVSQPLVGERPPDLIVWAENAFDRDPRLNADLFAPVQDLVRVVGAPLILPAILDAGPGFTNSNLLLDRDGQIVQRYDKVHLVPFGEYVPWGFARSIVPALRVELPVDGVPGEGLVPFDLDGIRVGTMICFESTYPWHARDLARLGSQVLVVTTNNASFQRSAASEQHLIQSQMRAVETGRSVVHTAISGISAIIEPDGSIRLRTGLFEEALLREDIFLSEGQTPATRFGRGIELGIALAAALATGEALARGRARRRRAV